MAGKFAQNNIEGRHLSVKRVFFFLTLSTDHF